jgi:alpha-L-rhamnosidase
MSCHSSIPGEAAYDPRDCLRIGYGRRKNQMKIVRLKINGIEEPLGFSMSHISVSWNVEDSRGQKALWVKIELAEDEAFRDIVSLKEGMELSCTGVSVEAALTSRKRYFVRVTIDDDTKDKVSAVTAFETGKMGEEWTARWIGTQQEDSFHPVFQKEIIVGEKKICRARLYICGLGVYETYLNQEKVGNELLAPFLNDYQSALQVQTYDITENLKDRNLLEVWLGNGWYKGSYGGADATFYGGNQFALIAEIHIDYMDGTREVIVTDESWKYRGSDVEESSIYGGEIYNRQLWNGKQNLIKSAVELHLDKTLLTDRYSLPVLVKETLPVKELIRTAAGEAVLDMGQNFAGWLRFYSRQPEGTKIHLEFGEVLQNDNFYNDNYRTAKGGFVYVSDGVEEWVRPHFTFFGFRYVKVSGWIGELCPEDFQGCVIYSDLERIGYLETGNAIINRLYQNSLWGQKSNFLDIPSDCPQRDERLGWTGDAQVFSTTASYHMDTRAFYRKYLWDMRHEQLKRNGGIPAYVPSPSAGPINAICAVWGDAATIIPDVIARMFNDIEDMKTYYPMMKDWVDYVGSKIEKMHGSKEALWDFEFQLGDWLALDGSDEQAVKGDTPDDYVATLYYYRSIQIVAEFAERFGLKTDAEKYRRLEARVRELLLDNFFTPVGHLSAVTQAAYVAAMKFHVYRNRDVLVKDFLLLLQKHENKIKCGFVGAPMICQVLAEYEQIDTAYKLLFQEGFPGWLYAVNLGATTIWERWNSLLPDGTISGTDMNSLNHYSYGSVVEFLYAYTAGIHPLEDGFQRAVIAPNPHGKLRYCNCIYHSAAGTYVVNWEIRKTGNLKIHIEIPFGSSALVKLPQYKSSQFELEAGIYNYEYMPLIDYRLKFSKDTALDEIFADVQASEILRRIIPASTTLRRNGNITVEQLGQLAMLGITEEMVEQLLDELKGFTYF